MEKIKGKSLFIVVAVIILLIFFHIIGILGPVERFIVKVTLPIQRSFYNLGMSLNKISNLNEISSENDRLRNKLSELNIDYVKLSSLESENNYLKDELNYLNTKNYQFVLADIIGKTEINNQVLIINKGSLDGVKEGIAATVSEGVVIGKVAKVEKSRSFIELLTSTQSQLAISLGNLNETNGLVIGQAGNSMLLDLIPQDQEINIGDLVITSGLENNIPRGLLIGEVVEVISQVGQIFKQAKIMPPFNYQNLQTLTLIIN